MDKKKKKILLAVGANIIALAVIIFAFTGESKGESLIRIGKELSQKLAPVLQKSEFFKESPVVLEVEGMSQKQLKNQKYQLTISYKVTNSEDIQRVSLRIEGKIKDGSFEYTKVDQSYVYKDGEIEYIRFDPAKDSALIIK